MLFMVQVAKHDFFLDLKGDLKEVERTTSPELRAFWEAMGKRQAKDEEDMDEDGNLKDFVVSDGYASMDSDASSSSSSCSSDDEREEGTQPRQRRAPLPGPRTNGTWSNRGPENGHGGMKAFKRLRKSSG